MGKKRTARDRRGRIDFRCKIIASKSIKTHKEGCPYRYIISCNQTAIENHARWAEYQLNYLSRKHSTYPKHTKHFLADINEKEGPFNPIAYGGGGGFLSHTTIVLAATLKPLKLWLPNFVTSCFYLFATI